MRRATPAKGCVPTDLPLLDQAEGLLDRAAEVALHLVHLLQHPAHLRRGAPQLGRVRGQRPRLLRVHVKRRLEHAVEEPRVLGHQVPLRVAVDVRHLVRRRIVLAPLDTCGEHYGRAEQVGEQEVTLAVPFLRVVRLVFVAVVRVASPQVLGAVAHEDAELETGAEQARPHEK
eukprot:836933-Prymnesium_polylepis.2